MKINVNYYAMFREAAGCSNEVVEAASSNAVELFESLKTKYDFAMCRSHVRLALNDAFVDWDTPLNDGDSIVFIPPVAGG
ncbi:MoaD/ThiS family protein [Pontiellaceae bacterium B1224]|nr:MoaD/ThiS family protein [Pontiellaceae bacterium B1224]